MFNYTDISKENVDVLKNKRKKIHLAGILMALAFACLYLVIIAIVTFFQQTPIFILYMLMWLTILFLIFFVALIIKREIWGIAILIRENMK